MSCGNSYERKEKSKERTHPLPESKSQRMGHPGAFTHSFFNDSDRVHHPRFEGLPPAIRKCRSANRTSAEHSDQHQRHKFLPFENPHSSLLASLSGFERSRDPPVGDPLALVVGSRPPNGSVAASARCDRTPERSRLSTAFRAPTM